MQTAREHIKCWLLIMYPLLLIYRLKVLYLLCLFFERSSTLSLIIVFYFSLFLLQINYKFFCISAVDGLYLFEKVHHDLDMHKTMFLWFHRSFLIVTKTALSLSVAAVHWSNTFGEHLQTSLLEGSGLDTSLKC